MSEKDGGPAQGQMIEPVAYRQDYAMGVADAARVCDEIGKDIVCPEECSAAIRALSAPPSVSDLERDNARLREALTKLIEKVDFSHDLHAVFNIKDCAELAAARAALKGE